MFVANTCFMQLLQNDGCIGFVIVDHSAAAGVDLEAIQMWFRFYKAISLTGK